MVMFLSLMIGNICQKYQEVARKINREIHEKALQALDKY